MISGVVDDCRSSIEAIRHEVAQLTIQVVGNQHVLA